MFKLYYTGASTYRDIVNQELIIKDDILILDLDILNLGSCSLIN